VGREPVVGERPSDSHEARMQMSYGNGGYAGATPATASAARNTLTEQPRSTLTDQMSKCDSLTKDLHAAISELEARLSLALAPAPQQATATGEKAPMTPGFVAGLSDFNGRIGHALERLNSLSQRLEL
jgi:hypothetical protein